MIEPLLDVFIPDEIAMLTKHHRAGEHGESVIVFSQVYGDVKAQENLAATCKLLADEAGVHLIAVEGSGRETIESPMVGDLRQLVAAGVPVSAAVLFLLQRDPGRFDVFGVDDMEANLRSQEAMTRLRRGEREREAAFKRIRALLMTAHARSLPAVVARLRRSTLRLLTAKLELTEQAILTAQAAMEHDVDMDRFQCVVEYLEIRRREQRFSKRRCRKQHEEFIRRLLIRVYSWFEPRAHSNAVTIDMAAAQPIIDYWIERTGSSRAEFDESVRTRGYEPTLVEVKQWLDGALPFEAQESRRRSQKGRNHVFHEELMRLALRVGVDFFDLHEFRDQVAATREIERVKSGILDELRGAQQAIVERIGDPAASRVWEIGSMLDTVYRGMRVELSSKEAEVADLDCVRLTSLCEELAALAGSRLAPDLRRCLEGLEPRVADAGLFLDLSRRRGGRMARGTIERMRERGADRAMLVAGGFHERAITQQLDAERGVSWSVVAPVLGVIS